MKRTIMSASLVTLACIGLLACSSEKNKTPASSEAAVTADSPLANKGIGPIKSVELAALNIQKAAEGEQIFQEKCSACHKLEEKYVGPSIKGVTERRSPEWILNMILNPQEMTQKDPVARELLGIHYTQMTFQNVSEEDAMKILEYFRKIDSK